MDVDNRNGEHLFETFGGVYYLSFEVCSFFCISKWIFVSNVPKDITIHIDINIYYL